MASTIKDVAKRADVSVATVSRVLTNTDSVSIKRKEKVLQAIAELNYQPNALGRSLRKAQSMAILVVIPTISNPFFSNILRSIQKYANKEGYRVLLMDAEQEEDYNALNYMEMLDQKQVDGIIMLTANVDTEALKKTSNEHSIVLACEYIPDHSIPTVSIDNISSARKICQYLIDFGYKQIAHLSGPMDTILSIDRLKGYKQALNENHLKISQSFIQEGDFSKGAGYRNMKKILAMEDSPDAVFAANDELAIGAIKAIKDSGLNVPKDIAVVGFDDIDVSAYFEPALTTVAQPTYEIGHKAVSLLISIINKEPINQSQFVLNDRLVIRESCGNPLWNGKEPVDGRLKT